MEPKWLDLVAVALADAADSSRTLLTAGSCPCAADEEDAPVEGGGASVGSSFGSFFVELTPAEATRSRGGATGGGSTFDSGRDS